MQSKTQLFKIFPSLFLNILHQLNFHYKQQFLSCFHVYAMSFWNELADNRKWGKGENDPIDQNQLRF